MKEEVRARKEKRGQCRQKRSKRESAREDRSRDAKRARSDAKTSGGKGRKECGAAWRADKPTSREVRRMRVEALAGSGIGPWTTWRPLTGRAAFIVLAFAVLAAQHCGGRSQGTRTRRFIKTKDTKSRRKERKSKGERRAKSAK